MILDSQLYNQTIKLSHYTIMWWLFLTIWDIRHRKLAETLKNGNWMIKMWRKFPLRNLPERCFVHRKVDSHVDTGWKRDGYTAALCFRWVFKMWKHFVSSFVNNRFLLLLRVVYRPFSQPDNNASFRSFQRIGESQILVSFNLIFVFIIY